MYVIHIHIHKSRIRLYLFRNGVIICLRTLLIYVWKVFYDLRILFTFARAQTPKVAFVALICIDSTFV